MEASPEQHRSLEEMLTEGDIGIFTVLKTEHPDLVLEIEKALDLSGDEMETSESISAFNKRNDGGRKGPFETVFFSNGKREVMVRRYRNGAVSIAASFAGHS